MQRESPREALWFARCGHASVAARATVLISALLFFAGFRRHDDDLATAGGYGFWVGLVTWFVLARARFLIAQRNHIALDGFVGRLDPGAHLRTSRAFVTRRLAVWLAIAAAVGAEMAWGSGALTLLAAAVAFGAVEIASRVFGPPRV
jgi:hypothetical protein